MIKINKQYEIKLHKDWLMHSCEIKASFDLQDNGMFLSVTTEIDRFLCVFNVLIDDIPNKAKRHFKPFMDTELKEIYENILSIEVGSKNGECIEEDEFLSILSNPKTK